MAHLKIIPKSNMNYYEWICDDKGNIKEVTGDGFIRLTGKQNREAYGFGWMNFIHLDDLERTYEGYIEAVNEYAPYGIVCRVITADKEWVEVQAISKPVFDEDDEFLHYEGVCYVPAKKKLVLPHKPSALEIKSLVYSFDDDKD